MDSTRTLFSANPRQLCSSSSEWTISLDEKLQSDIRGRIIGCQAQMDTFDFFFGLNLGQRLFSHTDNLSRTLQQTKMSALSGKRVPCPTKDALQKTQNETSSRSFYDVVLPKSKSYPSMCGPMLPRRTRALRTENWNWHWRANISCDRTRLLQANIL